MKSLACLNIFLLSAAWENTIIRESWETRFIRVIEQHETESTSWLSVACDSCGGNLWCNRQPHFSIISLLLPPPDPAASLLIYSSISNVSKTDHADIITSKRSLTRLSRCAESNNILCRERTRVIQSTPGQHVYLAPPSAKSFRAWPSHETERFDSTVQWY